MTDLQVGSMVMSQGLYITSNKEGLNIRVQCNWCENWYSPTFFDGIYYDLGDTDWIAMAATHFVEHHSDKI